MVSFCEASRSLVSSGHRWRLHLKHSAACVTDISVWLSSAGLKSPFKRHLRMVDPPEWRTKIAIGGLRAAPGSDDEGAVIPDSEKVYRIVDAQQAQDAQQMCGAAFLACRGERRRDSTRRGLTDATRAARSARGDAHRTMADDAVRPGTSVPTGHWCHLDCTSPAQQTEPM